RMDDLLDGRKRGVSLLHGDLWSGNHLCGPGGEVVLIDPAVHQGCPEAEFGMIELFGSCPPRFYDAYLDTNPFSDGWQRRVRIYVLYHLLNHLNLFGAAYAGQCQTMASKILS
ncbi:MAG: fructosamine kinase family protein, partial [Planctomycetota bacterium]